MLGLNRKCCIQIQCLHLLKNSQRILLYSTGPPSFPNYLVNSLGFSHQQAALTCNKLPINKVNHFKFYDNAISVVNFLKMHGCDDARVRKAVSLYPRILCSKIDKTLKPKFEILQKEGFSGSDLVRVISATPYLSVKRLSYVISNLSRILGGVENVGKVFSKSNCFTTSGSLENMISNITFLKNDYGINIDANRNTIIVHHTTFQRNPEFFRNVVVRVENELGIPRDSKMFIYGVSLFCNLSKESIESRCLLFKNFGWTEFEISNLMRRNPFVVNFSTENMRKRLGFLMNELGYDPGFLVSHSVLLGSSLEKRLLPRHRVLRVLKEKGLLDYNFFSAIIKNETMFLKMFVEPFEDVAPGLREVYQNSKGCASVEPLSPVIS